MERFSFIIRYARASILYVAVVLSAVHPALAQLQAHADGNNIVYSAGGAPVSSDDSYCATAVILDETQRFSNGNAPPCQRAPLNAGTFTCNWAGTHTVRAYAYNPDGKQIPLGKVTVTITVPPGIGCNYPPRSVKFDISDTAPAQDRRVLLSNMHIGPGGAPDYLYPHFQQLLARDAAIPLNLRTIYNGSATPGVAVTLRISDPADASPYVAGGPGIVQPVPGSPANDNVGALPRITGPGVFANSDGTYSVLSGSEGYIETELELDATARAGDNYRVIATATFEDGQTATATSGAITVWKRVFVEKRNMYRHGASLATDAPAGLNRIVVPDLPISSDGNNDEFRRDDYVQLMHAPTWGQPKLPVSFYKRVHRITANPRRFRARREEPGPGLITTNGTTSIVGNGTRFNRLDVGDVVNIPIGGPQQSEPRVVMAIIDNTHLTVDAAPTAAAADQPYTIGDPNLVPGRNYLRIPIDPPLVESYVREPLVNRQSGVTALNDAVIELGPTTGPGDFFEVSHSLLTGNTVSNWQLPLAAAYTEYIVLSAPGGIVSPIPRVLLGPNKTAQQFVDKWFMLPNPAPLPATGGDPLDWYRYPTPPNHQLLLVADTEPQGALNSTNNGFLLTDYISGEKAAIVNRGTVEYQVTNDAGALNEADPDVVLPRTLVHEMVHQWLANRGVVAVGGGPDDHCHPMVAYDSPVGYPQANGTPPQGLRFCLMSSASRSPLMPAHWNSNIMVGMVPYFYRYGVTTCHITVGTVPHSEYLAIRRAADPWTP